MAKIELTVAKDYVKWGLWEGLRELMQNGLDVEADGQEFSVEYVPGKCLVRFVTKGSVLEPKTLLIGYSTKRERQDQRGQFGEGYKLGILALVNAGHPVVIRTGDEKWTPSVAKSAAFGGEEVLVFEIEKKALKFRQAVEIEVGAVLPESWEKYRTRFLRLVPAAKEIKGYNGNILLDPERAGQIFVGGIYVTTLDAQKAESGGLQYGYDFPPGHVKLDRDRKMPDVWDVKYHACQAWQSAVKADAANLGYVDEMLRAGRLDVEQLRWDSGVIMEIAKGVASRFRDSYGEDAVPVTRSEQLTEIEYLGKRGVVVPEPMFNVLKGEVGSIETAREAMKTAVAKEVGTEDLTPEEAAVLLKAVAILSKAVPTLSLADVKVAEFRDEGTQGVFERPTGKVFVSRKMLATFQEALLVLVHEVAHKVGEGAADGSQTHQHITEGIWLGIVAHLVNSQGRI